MPGPRFPGPFLHRLTSLPLRLHELRNTRVAFIDALHRTHGPVVQIAPRTLSLSDGLLVHHILAPDRPLDRPGPLPIFHNYGQENLLTTVDGELHRDRRRPLRNIYSARAAEAEGLNRVLGEGVDGFVDAAAGRRLGAKETREALGHMLYDVMSYVVYGAENATRLLRDEAEREAFKVDVAFQKARGGSLSMLLALWFPNLVIALRRANLAPAGLDGSLPADLHSTVVGRRALQWLDEAARSQDDGVKPATAASGESLMHRMHAHLLEHGPTSAVPSGDYILSECLDHFWAGVSTTSDALGPLMGLLSSPEHAHCQRRLRAEIQTLPPAEGPWTQAQLRKLPYLDAVIREALRVEPPIPFSMERRISERDGPVVIEGQRVPAGWVVGAQPVSVGTRREVFPAGVEARPGAEADTFVPERWLEEEGQDGEGSSPSRRRDMRRHFMAFGSGARMCLGVNVAWSMMRGFVAGVYGRCETVMEGDGVVVRRWEGG